MDPTEPTAILPFSVLRSLLFQGLGDDSYPQISTPRSHCLGDIGKVVIIPYDVGVYIASLDKDENYFHVELYPELNSLEPKSHAEIWTGYSWRDSNLLRARRREKQAIWKKEYEDKKNIVEELSDALTSCKLPEQFCATLAAQIAANYKKHDLTALLKSLGTLTETSIADILKKYE